MMKMIASYDYNCARSRFMKNDIDGILRYKNNFLIRLITTIKIQIKLKVL